MHCSKNKTGLIFGIFLGFFHLIWSLLVYFQFAQLILDFVYRIHFLSNPFIVAPFGYKRAAALIVVTSLIGYVAGWFVAFLWNRFHK